MLHAGKPYKRKFKKGVLLTFAKGLKLQEKVFNTIQLKLYFCYFCLPSHIKNYAPIHLCRYTVCPRDLVYSYIVKYNEDLTRLFGRTVNICPSNSCYF